MKHLIRITVLLVTVLTNAQSNYEQVMQKAFWLWSNNKPVGPSNAFVGGAKYFGQDSTPFCKDLECSIELFAKFKPKSTFHQN